MASVLILGGGFGGLAAAHRLRSLLGDEHAITLLDRAGEFYMGFAKLWDLAGTRPLREGTRPLSALHDHGIAFRQVEVTGIDASSRTVQTSDGALTADAVLVALGAGPAPHHATMLAGDRAHDLYDGMSYGAIRQALATVDSGRVVVSVLGGPHKCPPAPYEAALIIDGLLRDRGVRDTVDVVMTIPQPVTLPVAGPDASAYIAARLADRGIELRPEHPVSAVEDGGGTVHFASGATVECDLLLGVPAHVAPPVVAGSDLVGPSGWIEPERHTLRTTFDGVYAVGDCTMIPTASGQLPMAGVFAAACGEVAAQNIAADLGIGTEATYDGHGFCFLELPGEEVAFVEGNFYTEPPDVTLTDASHDLFTRKQAYEAERLRAWFGRDE